MPSSIWDPEIDAAIEKARRGGAQKVTVEGSTITIAKPFPSPDDWRDHWIYFLLPDRFNNPARAPAHSWDGEVGEFQGGTFNGIRAQLGYLKDLGVGALWLAPVLKNPQFDRFAHHGYGIQDFLTIEPRFSSNPDKARRSPGLAEAELEALVNEAHARGMYVIFDVVLNHTGDVFEYEGHGATAPWRDFPYPIRWRDEDGRGRPDWSDAPDQPPADAAVWPTELRRNEYFRRQGKGGELGGDFESLKELVTDYRQAHDPYDVYFPVRDILIRAYQYLIARFDVDGFRIDTLKYVEHDFARLFGNAIREFAYSIGKKEFFTFGEVYDSEEKIASYVGRNTLSDAGDLIGVDAALDFPLFYRLPAVAKGLLAPGELARVFEHRQRVQRGILSSHGEASRFFVTFLDNHDQHHRFRFQPADDPHRFDDQLTLGLGCLFTLQGIPCVYYGTEQGLHGSGGSLEAVREALWGKPQAFDRHHPLFRALQAIAALRASEPALRFGRQYFRPISGDGQTFGLSPYPAGVVAYSRILDDREILVVANTSTSLPWTGEVLVDFALNRWVSEHEPLYSNRGTRSDAAVREHGPGTVTVHEPGGSTSHGPSRTVQTSLQPLEIQVLAARSKSRDSRGRGQLGGAQG